VPPKDAKRVQAHHGHDRESATKGGPEKAQGVRSQETVGKVA
jgi:hypothetical protein